MNNKNLPETMSSEDAAKVIREWCLQETEDEPAKDSLEETAEDISEAEKLKEEREELERLQKQLEKDIQAFEHQKRYETAKMDQEKRLFEMKWKLLEDEWRKLVTEQEKMSKRRAFFERIEAFEADARARRSEISVSVFFRGVTNASGLKKRYKDLIKIFHPDNLSGDTDVIQQINEEYEKLKATMPKHK